MSTNDTILDQCRREAAERYKAPDDKHPSWDEQYQVEDIILHEREAYAAALYAVASGRITKIGDCFVSSHRDDPTP